jgi:CRP/FNR family cyclic AMP-dependent transcriptional regulator
MPQGSVANMIDAVAAQAATATGSWICALAPSDKEELWRLGKSRRLLPGVVLSSPGEPLQALHMVLEGSVQFSVNRTDGAHCLLQIVWAGGSFGETAMACAGRESITATVRTEALLHVIPHAPLDRLLDERPALLRALAASLAMRARYQVQLLETLVLLRPRDRLRARLAGLAMSTDLGRAGRECVRLDVTQTELASMCALSRPVVNRILNDLAARDEVVLGYGLIAVNPRLMHRVRADRDGDFGPLRGARAAG